MTRHFRSLLVVLFGIVAIGFAANQVVGSASFRLPKDFLEYWSAARLNLRGENPYDPDLLLAEQQLAEPGRTSAVMMWNPPPALTVYAPLALLPARWAALLWIGGQLLAIMIACDLLWQTYAPGRPRWLAQLVGLTFVGTWWVVAYGQNAGLLLLGLSGFLHFRRTDRPLAAGACAALTALKPHLLAGFGVLLIADALTCRGRAVLASGLCVIGAALALAIAANPNVISQFLDAVRNPAHGAVPLHGWALPVPSYWLRMAFAPDQFWVQFVPCLLASAFLLAWRLRKNEAWDWQRALPVVVAVSVLTTPYGGWIFDLPVLLVPVIWCAGRVASRPVLVCVFIAGQIAVNVATFATAGALPNYWWVAPAVLSLCFLGFARRRSHF